MPDYELNNRAKRSFDDVYIRKTPHSYLEEMSRIGYQIGEQARPYCVAVAALLREKSPGWPVQMVDIGCSYGIGSAFVKYGCTFEELASFFKSRAPSEYAACAAATRVWLNVVRPQVEASVVGIDVSEPAVQFAIDAGLIERGVTRNLEEEDLTPDEQAWLESCNLLICTGAIGYVGAATFDRVLRHLGRGRSDSSGPAAVMTILRMFDPSEVRESFRRAGLEFKRVEGVRLPQRAFADARERREVVRLIEERGLDPEGWESLGVMYADLYVAGQPDLVPALEAEALRVARQREPHQFANFVAVANAKEESVALVDGR